MLNELKNISEPVEPDIDLLSQFINNKSIDEALSLIDVMNPDELFRTDNKGHSVLYEAVKRNCIQIIKPLLLKQPKLTDILTVGRSAVTGIVIGGGSSILHTAASRGNVEVVRILLDFDHKLIEFINLMGSTCLHHACKKGHLEVVKVLLNAQSSLIDTVNNWEMTVLRFARNFGHLEIVKFLLKVKPDLIDIKNKRDTSILVGVPVDGTYDIVKLLLSIRPKLFYEKDLEGNTVFHQAVHCGSTEIMKYFLRFDRSIINVTNNEGLTALEFAFKKGCLYNQSFTNESVILLVAAGARCKDTLIHNSAGNEIIENAFKIVEALTQGSNKEDDELSVCSLPEYQAIYVSRIKFLSIDDFAETKKFSIEKYLELLKLSQASIPSSLYIKSSEMLSRLQTDLEDIKALCKILLEHRGLSDVSIPPKYYQACRLINNSSQANLCKFLNLEEQEKVVPMVNKWCIANYFALKGVGKQINWTEKNIYLSPMVMICIIRFLEKVTEKGIIEDLRFE